MHIIKPLLGVLLLVAAAAGLFYWETKGRETVLTDPILVAASAIEAGQIVMEENLRIEAMEIGAQVEGALSPEAAAGLLGRPAVEAIRKNEQITESHFTAPASLLRPGESVFPLPTGWIRMQSSSLRRGDRVEIFLDGSFESLGIFRIAFGKDSEDKEVIEVDRLAAEPILDRIGGSAAVHHVEIVTDIAGYRRIAERIGQSTEGGLLLVQRERADT